jgi:hypothetical protein
MLQPRLQEGISTSKRAPLGTRSWFVLQQQSIPYKNSMAVVIGQAALPPNRRPAWNGLDMSRDDALAKIQNAPSGYFVLRPRFDV